MEWILIVGFILFAGLFAGSETAFISLNHMKIHANLETDRRYRVLEFLLRSPEDMIGVFLLGTNIGIVAATLIFTNTISGYFPNSPLVPVIVTLVLTPTVLIVADVIPKIVFRKFADSIMHTLAYFYGALFILFLPVEFLFMRTLKLILSLLGLRKKKKGFMGRDDFHILLDISTNRGILRENEKDFIESIMNFKNIRAREIMIPLSRIVCLEENESVLRAIELMVYSHHSRLPIYKSRVDNIVGFIENKDLLSAEDMEQPIKEFLIKGVFVPECVGVDKILFEMQNNSTAMIFVVDEYGGVAGIVTMQDLVAEIVGEFIENGEKEFVRVKDHFVADGLIDIDELSEELGLSITKMGFETLAGFAMQQLQKLPQNGDSFEYGKYSFTITSMNGLRIDKLTIAPKRLIAKRRKNNEYIEAKDAGKSD